MKAFIRADASVEIGMGHRVRCQALIHAFQALGWHCEFVVHRRYTEFSDANDRLIDSETDFLLLAEQADLVILDHYGYQASDINRLYQHQKNLLVLDDMNDRGDFSAAWVLNPLNEMYASSVRYPLTGSQYALLRPYFSQALKTQVMENRCPNKLLITLGGTDPLALTLPILQSLLSSGFPRENIVVMLGKNAVNAESVMTFCQKESIEIERGVTDVTLLMSRAKMAISAAGGTLFELACLGVPTVFAQVADNQTRSLEQHLPLDWCRTVCFDGVPHHIQKERVTLLVKQLYSLWLDEIWQEKARKTAQSLVDDQGANRVAKTIHTHLEKARSRGSD
ncbi:UDP-2,4-diacetamido-2,4,6-trideoxy-beta-L-altropyranose hydrolase [Marinomonas sp. GJ51-6]|uniref:PseG/SpsG family protein n=1 Tax=Marinomonas sp. GJ51-6 TaxID=2992802 RepID=UPI002934F0DA|nr:UDP-2,4-diacetamido-2,4,6-trideoxy-beta-L-altropyranose hydrolase [Marinomonas sp. GJ51-6]WOD08191.1 UDP-2,4-diacetamido-2,4,6-trideoxy-beta-L-altropyranose hydrolase [Marinomonas sp. GJ51-6]